MRSSCTDTLPIIIRNIIEADYPFLRKMLYESIFVPPGTAPFPLSIIDTPEISKYVDGWGKTGDFGLIAEIDRLSVGAIWGRLFDAKNPGYGFIDPATLEIGMAIVSEYRNKGIGKRLIMEFFSKAKENGYKTLSLSVDKRNRAFNFYLRHGFSIFNDQNTAYTMKIQL